MHDCRFDNPCIELKIIERVAFVYLLAFLSYNTKHKQNIKNNKKL